MYNNTANGDIMTWKYQKTSGTGEVKAPSVNTNPRDLNQGWLKTKSQSEEGPDFHFYSFPPQCLHEQVFLLLFNPYFV